MQSITLQNVTVSRINLSRLCTERWTVGLSSLLSLIPTHCNFHNAKCFCLHSPRHIKNIFHAHKWIPIKYIIVFKNKHI